MCILSRTCRKDSILTSFNRSVRPIFHLSLTTILLESVSVCFFFFWFCFCFMFFYFLKLVPCQRVLFRHIMLSHCYIFRNYIEKLETRTKLISKVQKQANYCRTGLHTHMNVDGRWFVKAKDDIHPCREKCLQDFPSDDVFPYLLIWNENQRRTTNNLL